MALIRTIPITKTELKDIQEAIINLINQFPFLPSEIAKEGVLFEQLKPKSISMCLSTVASPYKIRTDIDGSYISRYQFRLLIQTMDVLNKERIDSQSILSEIGEWLEGRTFIKDGVNYSMGEYPELSDNRKIIKLYKNTIPKLVQRLPSNIEITEAKYTAEYYVQNDF